LRINNRIKVSPVRLIGPEGEQLGIIPIREALDRAREYELDLVEVAPDSKPPVCRILDFGKLKYELAKKDKVAKKKQHSFQMKEMRYRPKIDEHDFQFKTRHVREFLELGSKVRVFVMFRGREMAYTELGQRVLDRVTQELQDVAIIETAAQMDRRNMTMVLAPRPEVMKKLRTSKPPKPEKNMTGDGQQEDQEELEEDSLTAPE
jgi:translation initiation factor IF-3